VLGARFDGSLVGGLPLAALEELGGADRVDVVMVHSGAMSQVRFTSRSRSVPSCARVLTLFSFSPSPSPYIFPPLAPTSA